MDPALERHRQQFEEDPTRVQSFEALEEGHFLNGEWDALVALYDRRIGASDLETKPAVRARLLFRLGQVLEEHMDDADAALHRYEEAARLASDFQPALKRLRELYVERERWELALQVGELEARTPMRPVERAAFHAELGHLWLRHLEDPAHALELFDRAFADDARCSEALRGRARALVQLGRSEEAADCLERLLVLAPSDVDPGDALLELARIAAGPLGDVDRALDLYDRALVVRPNDADAVDAAAAVAQVGGRWPKLVELSEKRFELAPAATERVEISLETAGLLLEQQGDAEAARRWLERARDLAPEDARIHLALADAAELVGDEAGRVDALTRVSELQPAALPVDALLEIGRARIEAGDSADAIAPLQRALERAPGRADVIDALVEAHGDGPGDETLLELLEARAAACEGRERAQTLTQVAALHERLSEDADAALVALRGAFQADPSVPGLTSALERLLRKVEAFEELEPVLESACRYTVGAEALEARCALAELHAGPLSHREGALARARSAFENVLDANPAMARALRGLQDLARAADDEETLLSALTRELDAGADAARRAALTLELAQRHEARGECERAAEWADEAVDAAPDDVAVLELAVRLNEASGRLETLVPVLERLASHRVGAARAELERRLAGLHLDAGREDQAVERLQAACSADPGDLEVLRTLAGCLERAGRLDELVRTYRELAEHAAGAEAVEALTALADLLLGPLDDADAAVVVLWRLASSPDAPEGVDERLERALERTQRFGELAQRLSERRQELDPGSRQARDLDLRRADLLRTHLGQFEQASRLYRSVYDGLDADDPTAIQPLDGLEACARGAGDDADLVWVLGERARHARDGDEWARAQVERARILDERLQSPVEARSIYENLLEAGGPGAEEAEANLIRLLERTEDWDALCERLERRVAEHDDVALRERLVQIHLDRRSDVDGAIRHLAAAAALEPGRAELWQRLADLHERAGHPVDAREALAEAIALEPATDDEVALRTRSARLAQEVGDEETARAEFERVIELAPGHGDAVTYLAECYSREGNTGELAELLEARLRAVDAAEPRDRALAVALRVRIAELRDQVLCDPEAAAEMLRPAVENLDTAADDGVGAAAQAAVPLADLHARAGRWEELAALAERMRRASRDAAAEADWGLHAGRALRELGQTDAAVGAYRDVLGKRPGDAEAETALRALYRETGDTGALVRLLEARLPHLAGDDEITARLELAGQLAADERGGDALVHLRRILDLDPRHEEARARALSTAEAIGAPDELLTVLDGALRATTDREQRAGLLIRRGELLAGALERPSDAVAAFREASVLAPDSTAVHRALSAALEQAGDWRGYLDELHSEVQSASGDARVELLERGARVATEKISPDAALPWLERLRAARTDDPELLARIADVHRRAGRPEALLRTLEAECVVVRDRDARRKLRLEIACILERDLGSAARALGTLEAARDEDPDDPDVLVELDRLYQSSERPRCRAEILEQRLSLAAPDERAALHRTLADLYRTRLAEPLRAAEHLKRALDAGAGPRAALLQARGEALRAGGRIAEATEIAEQELATLDRDDPVFRERRRELHRQLSDAWGRLLGDPDAALVHLRAQVDEPPPEADDELAAAERSHAEASLLEALRRAGAQAELAERLARRLEAAPCADGWLELGRLREEKLHACAAARDAFEAALTEQPDSLDALRGIRRCAGRLGDFARVADVIEQELALCADATAAERAALLRALGNLTWHRLGSTTRAVRAFAAALEAMPDDLEALRALQELSLAMEDWRGAAELYDREIELLGADDAERRRDLYVRIADLAHPRLENRGRAVEALRAADRLTPLEPQLRRTLADLLREEGDLDACAAELARWCDDERSHARSADQIELAELLETLERPEEALARVTSAIELDATDAQLWEAAGRLHETLGHTGQAADAWVACAEVSDDRRAGELLVRATALIDATRPEQALDWLRRAVQRDPACAAAHAARAPLAETLGHGDEAEEAGERALDLASGSHPLPEGVLLEAALVAARAARARGALEEATRFATTARAIDPDSLEALAVEGHVLFAMGEIEGARRALERRLEADDAADYPQRCDDLALLGAALESAGELDAALERYEEAIAGDAEHQDARAGIVRVHERAGRLDDARDARLAWANHAAPTIRARQLVRVAELELAGAADEGAAEGHLLAALEADPSSSEAHLLLTTRLAEGDRLDEALELSEAGIDHAVDADVRARLAVLRAGILEKRGERRAAAEAFGVATAADPRSCAAALARARILRALGEWDAAAAALGEFAENHPGDDPIGLAGIQFQRGRLLAGPLERVDEALDAYRAAIAENPHLREAHAAIASLLVYRRDSWDEALARHRDLLQSRPTDLPYLRGALRIAEGLGKERAVAQGRAILTALGAASPEERAAAPETLDLRVGRDTALENPVWDCARRIAATAAEEIGRALESASTTAASQATDDRLAEFRAEALRAEGRLAAPALVPLSNTEVGELLTITAQLASEVEHLHGDAQTVNRLSHELGRRARRRVRRELEGIEVSEIAETDFAAWRRELRTLAHACALDAVDGDLRLALCALLESDAELPAETARAEGDLIPAVDASPAATALLRHVLSVWLEGI